MAPSKHCREEGQRWGSRWGGSRADGCFGGSGFNLRVMLVARSPQEEGWVGQVS